MRTGCSHFTVLSYSSETSESRPWYGDGDGLFFVVVVVHDDDDVVVFCSSFQNIENTSRRREQRTIGELFSAIFFVTPSAC